MGYNWDIDKIKKKKDNSFFPFGFLTNEKDFYIASNLFILSWIGG